jgi:hypothetical protein
VAFTPCLLPINFSTGRGKTHLYSYEFYHPSIAAWQFGLRQLPIHLFFANLIKARDILNSALEYGHLKALTNTLTDVNLVNWAPAPAPFSSSQYNSWWSEWKLHLRTHSVAYYCAIIDLEYQPTSNEVKFYLAHTIFYKLFVLSSNQICHFQQQIETSPPVVSTSGKPIAYGPVIENPLIGHNASSIKEFMKGKRTLSTKTTSNKKNRRQLMVQHRLLKLLPKHTHYGRWPDPGRHGIFHLILITLLFIATHHFLLTLPGIGYRTSSVGQPAENPTSPTSENHAPSPTPMSNAEREVYISAELKKSRERLNQAFGKYLCTEQALVSALGNIPSAEPIFLRLTSFNQPFSFDFVHLATQMIHKVFDLSLTLSPTRNIPLITQSRRQMQQSCWTSLLHRP